MIFTPQQLLQPLDHEITGNEPWLQLIYQLFPTNERTRAGASEQCILATVHTRPQLAESFVKVFGEIRFAPLVDCSRCGDPIAWPVSVSFERYYKLSPSAATKQDLAAADLDEFEISAEGLDVAEMINELIQLELPTQLIRRQPDSEDCSICELGALAEPPESGKSSPFAVLSSLLNEQSDR